MYTKGHEKRFDETTKKQGLVKFKAILPTIKQYFKSIKQQ